VKTDEVKRERLAGWLLAGVLFVHLVLLRPVTGIMAALCVVLLCGAILRAAQAFVPRWLGRLMLLTGAVAVLLAQPGIFSMGLPGELAGMTGALFLLRAVTLERGLRVLFCILVVLAAIVMRPYETVGASFVVLDVVVLLLLAEQIHHPPGVEVSFWVSALRSLRVVVPVGIVVSTIFWLFPSLPLNTASAFTGFSGDGILDPRVITELSQSRRVALVARFGAGQPVPPADDLYWRAQVLEINDGLRWSRAARRSDPSRSLQPTPPPPGMAVWRYGQQMVSNRGGIVPVLDHAVFVEATRDGQNVVILDIGGAVLTAVGAGPLRLDVVSVTERVADVPLPEVADGGSRIPDAVGTNPAIREISNRMISPAQSTAENLTALAAYFRESGFTYSLRPGRIPDLAWFLLEHRRGFCEHYAAAAANLLRLGGVPARVVTGYRGGEWNPWLRTITVRDSEAHAWVEAWDGPSQHWVRFDPTASVASDFNARIARELNSDLWPWYRTAISYGSAVLTSANDRLEERAARVTSSEAWELVQPILSGLLTLAGIVWLIRNHLRRRAAGVPQVAARLLDELERRAARCNRQRHAGETPLGWLARLRSEAGQTSESAALGDFAKSYEAGVYRADGSDVSADLRMGAKRLCDIWKTAPHGKSGEVGKVRYTPARA